MKLKTDLALLGAAASLALAPAASAATTVSVRVEGAQRTLLPATGVAVPRSGSITTGGAPKGACPAHSAAGAFYRATHGHFTAKYYAGPNGGLFVTSILGEKPSGSNYWELFVNGRVAQKGICALHVRRGDRLLFADESGSLPPLVISAPTSATAGHSLVVKVGYWFTSSTGKTTFKPVAGVEVSGRGISARTDKRGRAMVTPTARGRLRLRATRTGYVRSETLVIRVR